jgi:hypothetical protein
MQQIHGYRASCLAWIASAVLIFPAEIDTTKCHRHRALRSSQSARPTRSRAVLQLLPAKFEFRVRRLNLMAGRRGPLHSRTHANAGERASR